MLLPRSVSSRVSLGHNLRVGGQRTIAGKHSFRREVGKGVRICVGVAAPAEPLPVTDRACH